jgi:hypothetical protein
MTYKIVDIGGNVSISKDNTSIPRSSDNRHYKMFIEDIALDNDTVEGPDVIEPSYVELRAAAYPSMVDQLDMQYWDGVNGTTIWADAIQAVKDAHPTTVTGGTTVGDVPAWVQEEADAWLANDQLVKYTNAVERLDNYILADGQEEVTQDIVVITENIFDENGMPTMDENDEYIMQDVTETIIISNAIPALEATITRTVYDENDVATEETIENPLITKDNAERAEAQAVVDATPQSVIDTYNGE